MRGVLLALCLAGSALAWAQDPNGPAEIDACGTLVQLGNCVLFAGAGGNYYVADTGRFRVGDAVRVVGTVDPDCVTICDQADGCVRGAVVYDPAVLPCGTALPDFPGDLVTGACTALSGVLLLFTLAGLGATRFRRARPPGG